MLKVMFNIFGVGSRYYATAEPSSLSIFQRSQKSPLVVFNLFLLMIKKKLLIYNIYFFKKQKKFYLVNVNPKQISQTLYFIPILS